MGEPQPPLRMLFAVMAVTDEDLVGHGRFLIIPMFGRGFSVSQLLVAAVVAMFLDQPPGLGQGGAVSEEAGTVEVDVGLEEWHRATFGDLPGFVQIFAAAG